MTRTPVPKHIIRRAVGRALLLSGALLFSAGVMVRYGSEHHQRWVDLVSTLGKRA